MMQDQITFTWQRGANAAQQAMMTARALAEHLNELMTRLKPLKDDWYATGSSSAQSAQLAEARMNTAMTDMTEVINRLGATVGSNYEDAADLDRKMAGWFA